MNKRLIKGLSGIVMSIGWLYISHHKFGDIDNFHNFLINHEHFDIYVTTVVTTIIPILGIIAGIVVMYDVNNNKYNKVDGNVIDFFHTKKKTGPAVIGQSDFFCGENETRIVMMFVDQHQ